jgi:hypothetical protein
MLRWPAQRPANGADINCGRKIRQHKLKMWLPMAWRNRSLPPAFLHRDGLGKSSQPKGFEKIFGCNSSSRQSSGAEELDNDIEMDGGSVKDEGLNPRGQPALPPEKVNLCHSGLARFRFGFDAVT